jgi:alpha-glucoside transport system permease protein
MKRSLVLAGFLTPALVVLGALVVYPIGFSAYRSLYGDAGDTFVGLANYGEILGGGRLLFGFLVGLAVFGVVLLGLGVVFVWILRRMRLRTALIAAGLVGILALLLTSGITAVRNNVIWVLVAPATVTALGLVFAVMTERVRWSTAFKVAVFMPMAISFLATGVIWRLVLDREPAKGAINAVISGVAGIFRPPGQYVGAEPGDEQQLRPEGGGFATAQPVPAGESVILPMVGFQADDLPPEATEAAQPPSASGGEITGTVWIDFTRGGGGESGVVDPTERGMPGVEVEAVRDGDVAATATAGPDGTFELTGLERGEYEVRLAGASFRPPFGGVTWLGPALITPSIIISYIWMWAGFAMVVIGAGLAAIPRDVLEAARVDGAGEWQVFRRVTVPLLAPVLIVVLVTLAINVLKIFDLVLVMTTGTASGSSADVVAVQMWKAYGAQRFGVSSALAVFLFLLVIPAMAFNIRRFRQENA